MDGCQFCRIAAGEEDAHVIRRADDTVAFLDVRPAVRGHVLVAPVDHRASLLATDDEVSIAVFETARTAASAMERALEPDGFSLFHTSGDLVGTVDHAHLHVLPRRDGDRVHVSLERDTLSAEAGAALAERIRSAL